MGYIRKKKVYKLIFEDEQFDGFEVTMRSLSVGELLDFDDLRLAPATTAQEQREKVRSIAATLAKVIDSWNLETEKGKPVPVSEASILAQDSELVDAIVENWVTALVGVSRPLGPSSPGGETTLEASIPMESL